MNALKDISINPTTKTSLSDFIFLSDGGSLYRKTVADHSEEWNHQNLAKVVVLKAVSERAKVTLNKHQSKYNTNLRKLGSFFEFTEHFPRILVELLFDSAKFLGKQTAIENLFNKYSNMTKNVEIFCGIQKIEDSNQIEVIAVDELTRRKNYGFVSNANLEDHNCGGCVWVFPIYSGCSKCTLR